MRMADSIVMSEMDCRHSRYKAVHASVPRKISYRMCVLSFVNKKEGGGIMSTN